MRRGAWWLVAAGPVAWAQPPWSASDQEKLDDLVRPQSRIEIGAGAADGNTFLGGHYNGVRPAFAVLNLDLRGRQTRYGNPDDDHVRWRIEGRDLGADARTLMAERGQLNHYRVTALHARTPQRASDSFQTPFEGAGSARLTLPAGFERAPTTPGMTRLTESLARVPVESVRTRNELAAAWWPDPDWEVNARWRHERQEGVKVRSLLMGASPGVARVAALPEPVDTVTQSVDLSAAYAGEAERLTLGYHAALFDNRAPPLEWQNAFSSAPFTGGTTGLPAGFPVDAGRAGKLPGNRFQRLDAQGVFDFSNTTRLALTLRRGRATQDEAFLPYSVNAALLTTPLPRASLDGRVDTLFAQARLTLRPQRGFHLAGTLKFDARDARTPLAQYLYGVGDAQLQPAPDSATDNARTNLPRSRRTAMAALEGDWRLTSATAVKGSWSFETIARRFMEVARTREHTLKAELRHGGGSPWIVNGGLSASVRRGNPYQANAPFLDSFTSAAYIESLLRLANCNAPLDCVRSGPFQAKFFLADRDRASARLSVMRRVGAQWSWLARAEHAQERFPASAFGRSRNDRSTLHGELNWQAGDAFTAQWFVAHDRQSVAQRTRQQGVGNPADATLADWTHDARDATWTMGTSLKWQGLADGRLTLEAGAHAVRARSAHDTRAGAAAPAAQNPSTAFPDTRYRTGEARLNATWQADRATQWKLAAQVRRIAQADWAFAGVMPTTLNNAIGTQEVPPDYGLRVLRLSWVRTFR
ncbi:MAG: MtrB/PioB family decaheme-associated outer membrane protein [Betaproteobacteria bacterium]|nr:MtrB/PioB family decaheme-associated outer membrane protein [Betaproteobacteria bacterium]